MKNKKIVFFDGVCNFCNKSVNFIWIRNSKRNIYYASLQSSFAKNRLFKLGVDLKLDTIYFYDGNKLLKKSRAVFKILEDLDGIYPFVSKIMKIFPIKFTDFFYDLIAKNRYHLFGYMKSCRIPNEEEIEFFLD